jgi:cytochrome c oxidase subunit 4
VNDHPVSIRAYTMTFAMLIALSAATLALSFAPLGAWQSPLALTIASAKAVLIVLFFMHLVQQRPVNRIVLLICVLLLVALIVLTAADVATRFHTMRPPLSG